MNNEPKKNGGSFLKYSSMAVQMLVTIGVFCLVGYKLDDYQQTNKPIYTALFGLAGVVVSLYQVIRQLNKK